MNACINCDSGWVVAIRKQCNSIFAFRCTCSRAAHLSKAIPEWGSKWFFEYVSEKKAMLDEPVENKINDYKQQKANPEDFKSEDFPF